MVHQLAEELSRRVGEGQRIAVARALNVIEDQRPEGRTAALRLLHSLPQETLEHRGHLVGITGPPGVGKSSLVASLIKHWRQREISVGVLAVDPTSPLSGGALLGDRLRMEHGGADPHLFIRSVAGRGELGGLSADVYPMSQVMLCAFDVVLVETIGVGQSEVDVMLQTDTSCLVLQPSSGDMIQFLKAGVVELPSVFVVNKSDLGGAALRTAHELRAALGEPRGALAGWQAPVLLTSARSHEGIEDWVDTLQQHRALLGEGALGDARREQAMVWGFGRLRAEFGRHGLERLGDRDLLRRRWSSAQSVFLALEATREEILAGWGAHRAPGGER